jgi:phosphohistidine phosphatase SixA
MAANIVTPYVVVDKVVVSNLRRAGNSWEEISSQLGVSTLGLRRWRQDNTDKVGFITNHLT